MCKTLTAMVAAILGSLFLFFTPMPAHATTHDAGIPIHLVVQYVAQVSEKTYIVRRGDTLSAIGKRFGIPWQGLYCENRSIVGSDPDVIQVGEKLALASKRCNFNQVSTIKTTTTSYVVPGTPQSIAKNLLSRKGWSGQFSCLDSIINKESGWNVHAANPSSGAYGIPQALPGGKMAGPWGYDWVNSAYVQLYWMILVYIPSSYGTPCGAWAFWQNHRWY